jgi:tRNA threonylcarbamoyladenosine biosynthesis protein TsaE
MKTYHSFSSEETKDLGKLLAENITNNQLPIANGSRALVFALQGDLGAGKTTFTQGFFKGLGIKRRAVSPTFVIMRRYGIRKKKSPFSNIYHFDAYRLKKAEDLEVLEFDDILSNPKNIILIEWPERVKEVLPKHTVWLKFEYGKKENERKIDLGSVGPRLRGDDEKKGINGGS